MNQEHGSWSAAMARKEKNGSKPHMAVVIVGHLLALSVTQTRRDDRQKPVGWPRQRGWTFRKTAPALKQERGDALKRRQDWSDLQPDPRSALSDLYRETDLSTKITRMRDRALRGERCRAGVPHGHWKTTTFTGVCA